MPSSSNPAARLPRPVWSISLAFVLALLAPVARPAEVAPTPAAKTPAATVPNAIASAQAAKEEADFFGLTRLHTFAITMPAAEWRALQTSANSMGSRGSQRETDRADASGRLIHIGGGFGGYFPWVHADIRTGTTLLANAGVRYKGNGSFNASVSAAAMRVSMKVKVDLYGKAPSLQGNETLNFNSGATDPSRIRESLAYAIFRAAGVPAPRTAFAEVTLTVPGLFDKLNLGVFTLVEQVNGSYTKNRLPSPGGLILKPEGLGSGITYYGETWPSYAASYRPDREATPVEQRRLIEFARLVRQADNAEFRRDIEKYLDVDEFLRFLAVNAMIVNNDSFLRGGHNFIMYLDPKSNRFLFLPWDVDLTMGNGGGRGGGFGGGLDLLYPNSSANALIDRLLDTPEILDRYRRILKELGSTVFNHNGLFAFVDAIESTTGDAMRREALAMAQRNEFGGGRTPLTHAYVEQQINAVQVQLAAIVLPPAPKSPAVPAGALSLPGSAAVAPSKPAP